MNDELVNITLTKEHAGQVLRAHADMATLAELLCGSASSSVNRGTAAAAR